MSGEYPLMKDLSESFKFFSKTLKSINNQVVQKFNINFLSFLKMTSKYKDVIETHILEEIVLTTKKKAQQ